MIESSSNIQDWLTQFPQARYPVAIDLLMKLQFTSRDSFSEWLKGILLQFKGPTSAFYTVRKFPDDTESYWDQDSAPICRPAATLGSEDLLSSVLSGLFKSDPSNYQDHPTVEKLRSNKVSNIVLIDDSSGSGSRIDTFINLFLNHKSLISWWSYGLLQFHVIVLTRTRTAEQRIRDALPGRDHSRRIIQRSAKLQFLGHHRIEDGDFRNRWGSNYDQIVNFCDSLTGIPSLAQRGYGGVMSNQVFHHSVPDNLPGLLWFSGGGLNPLFPGRSFPVWLDQLLAGGQTIIDSPTPKIDPLLPILLGAIKRGIRATESLARSIGLDPEMIRTLLARAETAGLISRTVRLTKAGNQLLWEGKHVTKSRGYDTSLYIPTKWCVGRETVQPSPSTEEIHREKTDFSTSSLAEDGDTGQVFLERTDARSAAPPSSAVAQLPSMSRMSNDAHGPKD